MSRRPHMVGSALVSPQGVWGRHRAGFPCVEARGPHIPTSPPAQHTYQGLSCACALGPGATVRLTHDDVRRRTRGDRGDHPVIHRLYHRFYVPTDVGTSGDRGDVVPTCCLAAAARCRRSRPVRARTGGPTGLSGVPGGNGASRGVGRRLDERGVR
jgi:hypothetical protein